MAGEIFSSQISYFELVGFALLGYDYCLTFPQEVERVWKQKLRVPALLFLVNRYLGLIYQFACLIIPNNFMKTDDDALNLPVLNFKEVTAVILVVICELVMTVRVYALYGCNHILLGSMLTLIAAQFALAVSFFIEGLYGNGFAIVGLFGIIIEGKGINSFVLWSTAFVIDTIVFVLTLRKTHRYFKNSQVAPLLHLFFRDGVVYFLVIGTSNLISALATLVFRLPTQLSLSSQFCASITSLLVSRLVLNIRNGSDPASYSSISTLMIGNLGGAMDELVDEDMDDV